MLTNKVLDTTKFDEFVLKTLHKKQIKGAVFCVENGAGTFSYLKGAGNIKEDQTYFIASVTKLYVTTIILKLRSKNLLQLEDKIASFLPKDVIENLHVLNGRNYSNELTVKHLLSNTSGLPDYFTSDAMKELMAGKDQKWGFDRTIAAVKQMKPKFVPGKKAHYCDTNFTLLGRIIETVTNKDIHTVFKEWIFDPLGLEHTFLFDDENAPISTPIYAKGKELHLPKYMSSIDAEGAIVSNAKESMIFLKAFMTGALFPKEYLSELKDWKLLFGPGVFFYGIGISNQPISILKMKNGLIGHWGQTGAFAFYHPDTDLYFTGTVNQITGHSVAAKTILSIIKECKKIVNFGDA